MEFDEYVAARRWTLVRVAMLLGCPEGEAPHLVTDVLSRSGRQVRAADNPDPEVYRALLKSVRTARERWPATPGFPEEDTHNAAGLAVRRDLAALATPLRDAVVLLHYGDLTLCEAGEALRTKATTVGALSVEGLSGLGARDAGQARDLLQQAADTIEVRASGPIEAAPGPRRWPWVAAAAAVAVALTAVVTRAPAENDDGRLAADQVPSLFGYDAAGARDLLDGLGLGVREQPIPVCDTVGRVLASDPPTGGRFHAGDDITIFTATPAGTGCELTYEERTTAWRFLDFANGRGPAPRFADRVYLVADGSEPEAIAGTAAADPSGWGGLSALKELRAASTRVVSAGATTYATARMTAETVVPPPRSCGVSRPAGAGQRAALRVTVDVDVEAPAHCPLTVDLYLSGGRIDAVVLYTERAGSAQQELLSPPPWVTGRRD